MSNDDDRPVDADRIERLATRIMQAVKDNYEAGPQSADRVFEALNALACVVRVVLKGTGDSAMAVEFFQQAMEQQMGVSADDE